MSSGETIPRFLWHLVWGGLCVVIALGLLTFIVLAGGAADPPRAGPLVYQSNTLSGDISLSDGPFTLEVTGHVSTNTDPATAWGVELSTTPFRILLDGHGFFAVIPSQPDFTPFIHIHTHGESNKLTLNVGNDGKSELRINDEIAWKGIIPPARSSAVRLITPTGFTLENISIFSHTTIPH